MKSRDGEQKQSRVLASTQSTPNHNRTEDKNVLRMESVTVVRKRRGRMELIKQLERSGIFS